MSAIARRTTVFMLGCLLALAFAPALASAATISGTVRDAVSDAALAGIHIRVYDKASTWDGAPVLAAETTSAADGGYTITGLADGSYCIAFADVTQRYRDYTFPGSGQQLGPNSFAYSINTADPLQADAYMLPLNGLLDARLVRVAGTNRYATSVQVSKLNWSGTSDQVVVASGDGFPDALSASALAGAYDAPLLLTGSTSLDPGVAKEIVRLQASKVFVIGGTGAVSSTVLRQIDALPGVVVERIGGTNRYATAEQVVYHIPTDVLDTGEAFVCRGDGFADALSAAPFSALFAEPILLTQPDSMPVETRRAWSYLAKKGADTLIAVGGQGAVGDGAIDQLYSTFVSTTGSQDMYFARCDGNDRFTTAKSVIDLFTDAGWQFDQLALANGYDFPDALSGGAAEGRWGGALLLTPSRSLDPSARSVLASQAPYLLRVQVLGGGAAIQTGTSAAVEAALGSQTYDMDTPTGRVSISTLGVTDLAGATAPAYPTPRAAAAGAAMHRALRSRGAVTRYPAR